MLATFSPSHVPLNAYDGFTHGFLASKQDDPRAHDPDIVGISARHWTTLSDATVRSHKFALRRRHVGLSRMFHLPTVSFTLIKMVLASMIQLPTGSVTRGQASTRPRTLLKPMRYWMRQCTHSVGRTQRLQRRVPHKETGCLPRGSQ